MIELSPAYRIKVPKQAAGIMIPAPPHVAGESPEPLLGWCNEAIQSAGLAHYGGNLGGGFTQHPHFLLPIDPWSDGLNYQYALQNTTIYQWNSQERLISVLACFTEIFKTWMSFHLFHRDRGNLLRHQPCQSFVQSHAKGSHALGAEPESRRQHQVRSIRFQQIRRANISLKTFGDQGDDIHESFGGFAALSRQVTDLIQGQNIAIVRCRSGLAHLLNSLDMS